MLQERYNQLPDGMEREEVQRYFDELFSELEASTDFDVIDATEALYELADRQWHTYTLLPVQYKSRIENWIGDHWLSNSRPFVINVGFVAGCLGLPKVVELLKSECSRQSLQIELRDEITRILKEMSPRIQNPFQGLGESSSTDCAP